MAEGERVCPKSLVKFELRVRSLLKIASFLAYLKYFESSCGY